MTVFNLRAIAILCFVMLCMSYTHSWAQNKQISWNEHGVLGFYKVTGMKPDFKSMITATPEFKAMPQDVAQQYLNEELLRLQWGLGTFSPEDTYLKINTKVKTSIIETDGKFYIASNFPGKSALNPPYFPYNLYDVWVALMLRDIKDYMLIEIDAEQKQRIEGFLPASEEKHDVLLKITYRISSGDPKPIMLDGMEQYMMLGDIAQFTMTMPVFHQSQNQILWEYTADWYLDSNEQDLLKILEGR